MLKKLLNKVGRKIFLGSVFFYAFYFFLVFPHALYSSVAPAQSQSVVTEHLHRLADLASCYYKVISFGVVGECPWDDPKDYPPNKRLNFRPTGCSLPIRFISPNNNNKEVSWEVFSYRASAPCNEKDEWLTVNADLTNGNRANTCALPPIKHLGSSCSEDKDKDHLNDVPVRPGDRSPDPDPENPDCNYDGILDGDGVAVGIPAECTDAPSPPDECKTNPWGSRCQKFCRIYPDICTEVDPPPPKECANDPTGKACQDYCTQYPNSCPVPPIECTTDPYGTVCQDYCVSNPSSCPIAPPPQREPPITREPPVQEETDAPVQCGLPPLPPCKVDIDVDEPPGDILDDLPNPDADQCIDCQSAGWENNQNFLSYALTVFANKFPFDALGEASAPSNVCPNLDIYNKQFEMCFINTSIAALKYPVWIIWLLKLIIH